MTVELGYMAVPREEYAALVRSAERIATLARMFKESKYIASSDVKTILGIVDEDKDGEEDDAEE